MYDGESSDDVEIVSGIDKFGRGNGFGASTGGHSSSDKRAKTEQQGHIEKGVYDGKSSDDVEKAPSASLPDCSQVISIPAGGCSGVGAWGAMGSGEDGIGDCVMDTSDSGAGGSASGIAHTRGTGNSGHSGSVRGASAAPAAAVDHFNPRSDLAPVIVVVAVSTASNVSSVTVAACCSGVGAGGETGSGEDGIGDCVMDTSDSGAGGSVRGIAHTRGTGNSGHSSSVRGASVVPTAAADHFNPRTDLAPVSTVVTASTAPSNGGTGESAQQSIRTFFSKAPQSSAGIVPVSPVGTDDGQKGGHGGDHETLIVSSGASGDHIMGERNSEISGDGGHHHKLTAEDEERQTDLAIAEDERMQLEDEWEPEE